MSESVSPFLQGSSVVLSTIAGYFVSMPLAIAAPTPSQSSLIFGAGILAGLLIGLRRRKSRAFFYFCVTITGILASLISFASFSG